jgi:hypothetical protein
MAGISISRLGAASRKRDQQTVRERLSAQIPSGVRIVIAISRLESRSPRDAINSFFCGSGFPAAIFYTDQRQYQNG